MKTNKRKYHLLCNIFFILLSYTSVAGAYRFGRCDFLPTKQDRKILVSRFGDKICSEEESKPCSVSWTHGVSGNFMTSILPGVYLGRWSKRNISDPNFPNRSDSPVSSFFWYTDSTLLLSWAVITRTPNWIRFDHLPNQTWEMSFNLYDEEKIGEGEDKIREGLGKVNYTEGETRGPAPWEPDSLYMCKFTSPHWGKTIAWGKKDGKLMVLYRDMGSELALPEGFDSGRYNFEIQDHVNFRNEVVIYRVKPSVKDGVVTIKYANPGEDYKTYPSECRLVTRPAEEQK